MMFIRAFIRGHAGILICGPGGAVDIAALQGANPVAGESSGRGIKRRIYRLAEVGTDQWN
ncbi:MAG: hypothetical protein GEU90_08175 [Gemmatimonas sp.]|nr:hypothetical protein [Gemmatimonas sp.]